jgi:hypothetical protein
MSALWSTTNGRDCATAAAAPARRRGRRPLPGMQAVKPATAAASAFYQDAVGRLNDVLSARRNRLADAGGLSAPIVGLIVLGSFVILGYTVLVGSRSAAFHAAGAGAIALVVGFSLVVLIAYNYPYAGSLAIGTAPYRAAFSPSISCLTGRPAVERPRNARSSLAATRTCNRRRPNHYLESPQRFPASCLSRSGPRGHA